MSVNRSILKKSRHIGCGVFIVHSSMLSGIYLNGHASQFKWLEYTFKGQKDTHATSKEWEFMGKSEGQHRFSQGKNKKRKGNSN